MIKKQHLGLQSYKTGTEYDLGTSAREPRAFISAKVNFCLSIGIRWYKLATGRLLIFLKTSGDIMTELLVKEFWEKWDRVFTAKGNL